MCLGEFSVGFSLETNCKTLPRDVHNPSEENPTQKTTRERKPDNQDRQARPTQHQGETLECSFLGSAHWLFRCERDKIIQMVRTRSWAKEKKRPDAENT